MNLFNQLNPHLESTLTLTVTGPGNYYYFDFQTVNMTTDTVGEYSFTLSTPNVAGTYVMEVSLVPAQLTAYDAKWLEANKLPTEFGYSSAHLNLCNRWHAFVFFAVFSLFFFLEFTFCRVERSIRR